jgi:hypothetical protein
MKRRAFTLVEVLVMVLFIGIAMVSLLAANAVFTQANGAGVDLSTAEFLIEQVKELTAQLPVLDPDILGTPTFGPEEAGLALYDDLDDFDGAALSPPIDAYRQPLNDFAAFTQQITVQNVNAADFEQVEADLDTNFVRVTVTVYLNSERLSSASWVRANY